MQLVLKITMLFFTFGVWGMFFKRKQIKVSVVLPVYNDALYIEQCMENLIHQTLQDIEIICVDDGSTDNTYSLLKKYARKDKRVQIIKQENKGAGNARNVGMALAKGDYIYFPDSDDIPKIELLEKSFAEALETESDIVVFRSSRLDDTSGKVESCTFSVYIDKLPDKYPFSITEVDGNFFRFFMGWAWDKLFKRSFIESINLSFQEQRTTNDMFFVYMALVNAKKISILDEELYTQRINVNDSLSMTRDKSWDCFLNALNSIKAEMINLDLWPSYEPYFVDYALHSCLANLRILKDNNYGACKKLLLDKWFKLLGIENAPKEWFTSPNEYDEYLNLLGMKNE